MITSWGQFLTSRGTGRASVTQITCSVCGKFFALHINGMAIFFYMHTVAQRGKKKKTEKGRKQPMTLPHKSTFKVRSLAGRTILDDQLTSLHLKCFVYNIKEMPVIPD